MYKKSHTFNYAKRYIEFVQCAFLENEVCQVDLSCKLFISKKATK